MTKIVKESIGNRSDVVRTRAKIQSGVEVMENRNWNSTPILLSWHKKQSAIACFVIGSIIIIISAYMLATEAYFRFHATTVEARIVEVRHEYVPAGVGSVLSYVPVVELEAKHHRIRVETSSEENIYDIGSTMSVICDSISQRCIKNTFFNRWNGVLDLLLALIFLVPSFLYL